MSLLPQGLALPQLSTKWAAILNVLLNNPQLNRSVLKSQKLVTGVNSLNHGLGRNLQGWNISRMRGVSAAIYDLQDTNTMPDLTLVLNCSTPVVVDIECW